ncbi:MAG: laccase domain-containing protein, partial [Prevotella sp.]|nr:laccase domain-containing protein [Prevotella sp.]
MLKEYTVAEGVLAFSTMRKGGVSLGNYSEFNINEYCGDSSEHIWENRRLLAERLGVSADHIVMPHQVHGIEVRRVDGEFFSKPEPVRKMILEGVDALITDLRGVCIGVSTADCIPVLLY